MAVAFYNLNSDAGLKKFDEYLLTRSYISGYQASKDDITVYSSLPKPPSSEYVNASRWYKHIDALLRISGVSGEGCGVIIEVSAPIPSGVVTPPATDTKASVADDDNDVDLFGEETEEKKKGAEEHAAAVKASSKTKECNSWHISPFSMQAAAGQLSAPVPPSEKGANGSSKDFKKVQMTKRTFVETVTKAPRFGDEVMEEAGDANWFEEEILVESDSEDEEEYWDGIPVVKISKDLRKKLIEPWKNALILKFLGKRISFRVLQHKLLRMWAPQGTLKLIDLGYNYYVARFELEKDCMRVLFEGPWKVFNHYVVPQRWKPEFIPRNVKAENMAVLVRLPGLPMECFREDTIKLILKQVGTPLKLDWTTAGVDRRRFVRAAIEIDLSKPLVSMVKVESMIQRIEFEGLHIICFGCGEVSHCSNDCPKKPCEQPLEENQMNRGRDGPRYGPWMLVQRKGKTPIAPNKKQAGGVQAGGSRTSPANRFTAI